MTDRSRLRPCVSPMNMTLVTLALGVPPWLTAPFTNALSGRAGERRQDFGRRRRTEGTAEKVTEGSERAMPDGHPDPQRRVGGLDLQQFGAGLGRREDGDPALREIEERPWADLAVRI